MARCIDCAKASLKKMKCFLNSKKSYKLSKEDLYRNARCEFFVRKRKDHRKDNT